MPDLPKLDLQEIAKIREVAASGHDQPVFMLNLNRYTAEADYPNGDLYRAYNAAIARILRDVGGQILWRTSARGHVVGNLVFHEAIGVRYPTHEAFLNVATAPSSDEFMRLRDLAVAEANLIRCDAY